MIAGVLGRAAIAVALAGSPTAAPAETDADEAEEPDIEQLAASAQAAFDAGDYDRVVILAKTAYAASGSLSFLYAQAHAERFRGNCRDALGLYGRVIAADPVGPFSSLAREGIQICEAEAEGSPAELQPPPPVHGAPAPTPSAPSPDAQSSTPTTEEPDQARGRRPDAADSLLLAGGAASAAVAVALFASGGASATSAERAADEGAFAESRTRARGLMIGGAIASGVAVGLLAGSIARFVGGRRRQRVAVRVKPGFGGIVTFGRL